MKHRTGYVYKEGKSWVARITFTDETGRRRNVKRYADTKTGARHKLDALRRTISERGQADPSRLTFREAAVRYADLKLIPPEYVGEKKVAGLRSLSSQRSYLKALLAHFGNRRLKAITHGDLEAFKLARLKTPTRGDGQRSIASVNREMQFLRTILGFAVRQGWIAVNPFSLGESLISKSDENSRERILSLKEEEALLAACTGSRAHLRPIIITLVDTGLRSGEALKARWIDVDFTTRLIYVRAINAKTGRAREVAMTIRLEEELHKLWEASPKRSEDLVFGLKSHFRRAWIAACKEAEIVGIRPHDLRHTCVSRMISAGVAHGEAMKVSGHATLSMLGRYLNLNTDALQRAAKALDAIHEQQLPADSADELIN